MTSTFPDQGSQPIASVVPGMRVFDSAGEEIGTVEYVKMGDSGAVTTQRQEAGSRTFVNDIAASVTGPEPDVAPSLAARLVRTGFVKVDSRGLFESDRYVAADEIAEVIGRTVHLKVTRDQLAVES